MHAPPCRLCMAAMSNDAMMARLAEPFGSFPDILMEWSRIKGDDLALRDDRREVYWAELVGLVERLSLIHI